VHTKLSKINKTSVDEL
jgi:hypothetical protein